MFENATEIRINNQVVKSIVLKDSGEILFEKSNDTDITNLPAMTLTITGSSFSSYSSSSFTYTGKVYVDWGDGTDIIEHTGGQLNHSFTDGLNSHTVKVYGYITSLGKYYFRNCTGLTSINIPSSVTSLGTQCFRQSGLTSISISSSVTSLGSVCFYGCTQLTSVQLNWQTSSTILTYESNWIQGASPQLKFYIPAGTAQLYIDKSYPSNKLEEEVIEKIDTNFISSHGELFLQDINENGLMNKTIIVQICSNGSIETVTVTTAAGGLTNISTISNDVKDATFDGDDEYNGCSYTNPNFLCKGTIK